MEKRTDTEYKNITIFLYIKLPLLALVQKHTHASLKGRSSIFNLLVGLFSFLFFLITPCTSKLSNALRIKCDLPCALQRSPPTTCSLCSFFCLFHITKLQLYSHMFKFKFLFSNALKKQQKSSVLLVTLRLQNSFC